MPARGAVSLNKITNFRALLFIVVTPLISCATNLQPIAREPAKIEIEPGDEKTLATLDSALVRLEDAKLDFPSL